MASSSSIHVNLNFVLHVEEVRKYFIRQNIIYTYQHECFATDNPSFPICSNDFGIVQKKFWKSTIYITLDPKSNWPSGLYVVYAHGEIELDCDEFTLVF